MSLPGSTITRRDAAPSRSAPTDTSVWFVVGHTEKGPVTPQLIEALDEYVDTFGARVSYGLLYDALDAFFREGGSRAYVSRAIGPTPVLATAKIYDAAGSTDADRSLIANAASYGDWGNSLNVEVLAPVTAGFRIKVTHDVDGTLETSDDLATQAAAIAWAENSDYIRLTLGPSAENPRVQGPTSLATGTDDHASATDATWATALGLFTADLGPGQVSMPGRTTAQSHADTLAHADSRNRVALIDLADTASKATLVTAAGVDRDVTGARSGGAFAPWAVIPGIVAETTRTVPYSAIEAGIIARNDSAGLSPNTAAAGERHGVAVYAIGLSQTGWTDAEREELNDAGVNVARILNGLVTTFGYRTLADPSTQPNYILLSNARLVMEIVALGKVIANSYVFSNIDGQGFAMKDFAGDLTGMVKPYYDDGSLYGTTAAEAFAVNVGPQVNTPTTIAELKLRALIELKLSPFAERTEIDIVSTAVTQGVS